MTTASLLGICTITVVQTCVYLLKIFVKALVGVIKTGKYVALS